MAESKVEQLARETELELALVKKDVEGVRKDVDSANLNEIRERLAVLEDRVTEFRESKREADRRYWQFVVLFVGGILTLAINLVVSFIRK